MAPRAEQKEESRARILASAGRGFRRSGYGGLGVDGLAKEAGVTSGAFYAHFRSKADAFREAVATGLGDLRGTVLRLRGNGGDWRRALIERYMGERRTVDLAESCALQSLTGEVARAGADIRDTYQAAFQDLIDSTAEGLHAATAEEGRARAIALLALLSGGVSLARAVNDPALAEEVAAAVQRAALAMPG